MTVSEADIDHLIQLWGHKLGTEHPRTRAEAKRILERQDVLQKEYDERPVTTFPWKGF
jgi:hypothetical protein